MSRTRIALAVSSLITFCAAPVALPAAPLAPSKPSQLVTAFISSGSSPACPTGIAQHFAASQLLTSSGASVPFVIPPKSVFVVTSFDYSVTAIIPDGQLASVGVFAGAAGPQIGMPSLAASLPDAADRAIGTGLVPGGLVVKPPAVLCGEFQTGLNGSICWG